MVWGKCLLGKVLPLTLPYKKGTNCYIIATQLKKALSKVARGIAWKKLKFGEYIDHVSNKVAKNYIYRKKFCFVHPHVRKGWS